jgi:hypothetical protein
MSDKLVMMITGATDGIGLHTAKKVIIFLPSIFIKTERE